MGEVGLLEEDDRVELIDGRILRMAPIGSRHSAYVALLHRAFRPVEDRAIVRVQDPIVLDEETEPQPDIAVVRFKPDLYADAHPRPEDVLLLIEVSDTSLEMDREVKLPLYAASAIPEVWIVNLVEEIVEVYRDPSVFTDGTGRYRIRMDYPLDEPIRPSAFPELEVKVSLQPSQSSKS